MLIEMPVALNRGEVEEIRAAAPEHGVFAMEAMWMKSSPLFQRLISNVRGGAIRRTHRNGPPRRSTRRRPARSIPEEFPVQIRNSVFIVTGGGNGIGRHVVLQLLSRGAQVAAVDLDADALDETRTLARAGNALSTHTLNVADNDAVRQLPAIVKKVHGQIDGIVNVAGIIHRFAPMAELSRAELERIVNVNFWGTVNTTLAVLPILRERPAASIANISSLSALLAFASQGFYGATKAAVKQFSEALFEELQDTNVTVTTVFPGNISTNISGNSGVAMIDAGGRKVRATTPERTAREIVDGIEKGSFRVLIGSDARLLDRLARLAPKRAALIIARQMKSVM
jgi:short-subunit dehydrogenase